MKMNNFFVLLCFASASLFAMQPPKRIKSIDTFEEWSPGESPAEKHMRRRFLRQEMVEQGTKRTRKPRNLFNAGLTADMKNFVKQSMPQSQANQFFRDINNAQAQLINKFKNVVNTPWTESIHLNTQEQDVFDTLPRSVREGLRPYMALEEPSELEYE